jgi:two-component system chemotaxis response regulator CheY
MEPAAILEAIASLAWPAIVVTLLIKAYPSIQKILDERSFHVKYGETEVTVQGSTNTLIEQISDLQNQVIALQRGLADGTSQASSQRAESELYVQGAGKAILWVDDRPGANAYERLKFEKDGYRIVQAISTSDALDRLRSGFKPDIIISDMERAESGTRVADAGLQLLKEVRKDYQDVPFFIYTSTGSAQANRQAAVNDGANGITSSSVSLIQYVSEVKA